MLSGVTSSLVSHSKLVSSLFIQVVTKYCELIGGLSSELVPGLLTQVKAIPEEMEYYGKGPLLSAKELDIDVAWERARQMQHACEEVHPSPVGLLTR